MMILILLLQIFLSWTDVYEPKQNLWREVCVCTTGLSHPQQFISDRSKWVVVLWFILSVIGRPLSISSLFFVHFV